MRFSMLVLVMVFVGFGDLVCTDAAVPLSSSTRPFIWASMAERDAILQKIEDHSWAANQQTALINRVQSNLNSYLADRDAYLRQLPVNWSLATPRFYTTLGEVNTAWRTKLDVAQDCSVIYYLTGDSRYAELAADVLHNSVRWLLETPKSSNTGIGGWTFHDSEWLYESRSIGSQMPIIYDFLHGYLQSNSVYDVHEGAQKAFSFTDAQSVLKQMRNLTRDKGYAGTNWCALMGESMILNTLAIDNVATRNTYVDEFLHTDFQRQDSLKTQHDHFDGPAPYSCYPESLGYSKGVVERNSYCVALVDRYDPSQNYPAEFPKLIQSLHRTKQMHFPKNSYQVQFGDGHRMSSGGLNYSLTHMLYSQAKAQGRTDLMALYGGPLAEGIESGKYNRTLAGYSSLGMKNQVLTLLWGAAEVDETPKTLDLFRTDTLPYSGLALQRNFSPNGNDDDGLMCFVQGAGFVHSHASGMNMELYGEGRVLGVKGYGRTLYARSFSSANTVIVNGYSRGAGGWVGIGINTVQLKAMEPATRENPVSPNMSFSCTTFADNKGDGAEATQERTMAIVRTSPTTGFYFDLFRSDSSKSGEYHDYLYHNVGDTLTVTDASGAPLSFTSQPDRFQNDTNDDKSPGWGYLTDTEATGTVTDSVRAQFKSRFAGETSDIYMDMHIPGDSAREYATALAPSDGEHPAPYNSKKIPTLIVRKTGAAWNNPFAAIYEPHRDGANGGIVQQVTSLKTGTKVVGMKVVSIVAGQEVTHYIIANTGADDVYEDPAIGLYFKGRFAIASHREDGSGELYIGEGSILSYGPLKVESNSGNNTQVSVIFDGNLATTVTANDAVTVEQTGLSFTAKYGPIAHWPLDEGTGTITTNSAKSRSTATLDNGATWGSDATRETYVSFDGTDDRITTSFTYALADTNDFTWAWWAKKAPTSHPSSIMVGNRYGNTGTESLEFIKFMPGEAKFSNTDDADTIETYNYSDLPNDEWHHYAMVKSGTNYQWYVDGAAEGAPETFTYSESTPLPFLIGGDGDNKPNEHFEGSIDDVILYKRALTTDEVANVKDGIYLQIIPMAVVGSAADMNEGATWEDGLAPHEGANYIVQMDGNLRSPDGSSTFAGESLTVEPGGKFQVRALKGGNHTTTVGDLMLSGGAGFGAGQYAQLVAGTGTDAFNVINGKITNSGSSRLGTYGDTINRGLEILSQVNGDGNLRAGGGGTVTINNAANTFAGTWQVDSGSTLQFGSGEAVGPADVEVLEDGTLNLLESGAISGTLIVADVSTASVNLGAYSWTVAGLVFGGSTVVDGVYSVGELNAFGSNPVFSGTGIIRVGTRSIYDPLAHWKLDEGSGTTATDFSGLGYTGSLLNGATWGSDATRDSYVSFDGTDDRISTLFAHALSSSDNFTWTWWAKRASTEGTSSIMVGNRYSGTGAQTYEFYKFTPDSVQFANTDDTAHIEKYDYANIGVDGWHHYAMVKRGTLFQWYVDGVAEGAPVSMNYNETDPLPFLIGGDGDNKPNEHFHGSIDDVALYEVALSSDEVNYVKGGLYSDFPYNNEAPTISSIGDQSILMGAAFNAMGFTVDDSRTPVEELALAKASSNTALVPESNITFGGSGANRTVSVTPMAGVSGVAFIDVVVSDGDLDATSTFKLTVYPADAVQYAVTNNTVGTTAWVCPDGITEITVECRGGGGAGGAANASANNVGGGGGAGGAYARSSNVPVTSGNSYTVNIPAAATAPAGSADGARFDGADVTFAGDSSVTVIAAGGQGGECKVASVNTSGSAGVGSTAGCIGDVVFAGGNGVQWGDRNGGAGGGGAGNANPGGNGVDGTGGLGGAEGGGSGGGGRAGNATGQNGNNPGGGGGGAKSQADGAKAGGAGGLGQIIITYVVVPVVDPPTMQVEQADGNFSFSWSDGGFKLQYCTNLIDDTWFDYEGGGVSPVTVAPTNTSSFFRLIEQ